MNLTDTNRGPSTDKGSAQPRMSGGVDLPLLPAPEPHPIAKTRTASDPRMEGCPASR